MIYHHHASAQSSRMAHVSSLAAGSLIPPTPKVSSHGRRPPPPPIRGSNSSGSSSGSSSGRADVISRRSAVLVFGLASATLPLRPAAEASTCADLDPTSALAQARTLYGSGRLAEAEDLLVRAAAAAAASTSSCNAGSPNDQENTAVPPLLKLLGDVRVDSYRYAEAVDAYTAAIASNRRGDSAPGAHFGRANAHEGLAALAAAAGAGAGAGAWAPGAAEAAGSAADSPSSSVSGLPAGSPRRRRQATMGADERREYEAAVDDYTRCLELRPAAEDPAAASVAVFERAQAERALGRWAAARVDYDAAAELFLKRRLKKEAKIAEAQAAFATFEAGEVARARTRLESLSRQLYSSDVRAALVACYWTAGEVAKAEDQWLGLCDMEGATCSKYVDEDWLTGYRKWTPRLAESMADFLKLRSPAR